MTNERKDLSIEIKPAVLKVSAGPATVMIGGYLPRVSVVAFIDILGFRQLVTDAFRVGTDSTAREALGAVLKVISTRVAQENARENGCFRATAFSDSVVISDELQGHGIQRVLDLSAELMTALLWRGFACRGGIASGDLVHQEGVLLGPGLLRAYDLENSAAVYPRIVVADSLSLNAEERPGHWRVQRDQDGCRFLDVFYRLERTVWDGHDQKNNLPRVRERIVERIQQATTSERTDVVAKWRWLASQFNIAANRHAGNIPPIEL